MRKFYLLLFFLFGLFQISKAQTTIPIYDNVLFYDGYAALVNHPTAPDVTRLRNDLFTKKLTPEVLSQIGSTLILDISISAACDNYDRIGNINLALVPKGSPFYSPATTSRIELARFITPFMNKNVAPNLVPYTFTVDNATKILKDEYLNTLYDFWIEFELFGVPYAANTQIAGCSGRNDVFYGTLNFVTNTDATVPDDTFILPLNFKKDLNNYAAGASDAIGTTVRTINFNLDSQINNAKFYLITSNHGANSGGEEYNRRWHYISLDSNQILTYRPGELTCEPYRIYNTQANGIYGPTPRTPSQWQSFSNWCPGSVIPIREISLGNLSPGAHSFQIAVPDAVFVGAQGYIPVSLYLQGENAVLGVQSFTRLDFDYYPNPAKNSITVMANSIIKSIQLCDVQGRVLLTQITDMPQATIDVSNYSNGIYFLKVDSISGEKTKKIIKE
ncbi:T9SS type A sorting domain-containing protein [Flavobacterium sp. J49]|uniref:peptide-N-glycosidase F-related protein n=1 Tax=Flavobacterium sp. J49 TaxID=2718534 RepID=UPI0015942067|nr:peptide-N-glycosidase F-related protein [Flavobacterium sp. J49]MBF6640328.1 T9SS type A sorting domain-containing protein [Flavobacterium sp. J49]NIC01573.1 T9SS type A sorting domain-containing protein [Flavobacterium sp. J49]